MVKLFFLRRESAAALCIGICIVAWLRIETPGPALCRYLELFYKGRVGLCRLPWDPHEILAIYAPSHVWNAPDGHLWQALVPAYIRWGLDRCLTLALWTVMLAWPSRTIIYWLLRRTHIFLRASYRTSALLVYVPQVFTLYSVSTCFLVYP